jgi:hypothetical protein
LFIETNTSVVFKEVWHKADLEPEAQTHYIEMKEMARESFKFHHRSFKHPVFRLTISLVKWLDVAPGDDSKDLNKCISKLAPFFFPEFLETDVGERFKDSFLFRQEKRAKLIPDIRTSLSNVCRPADYWNDWDEVKKNMETLDDIPAEWDIAIRPIIAKCK